MQNFPPLAPYQFFWNWNKCFNSKKPAALQAERQAVTWLLFQATGWASVDFEHQGYFIPSLASLVLHLTTESFPSSLLWNSPHLDPLYGRETRTVAGNIHLLYMLQMLMEKKNNNYLSSTKCVKRDLERYIHVDISFPLGTAKANKRKEKTNEQ